MQDKDGQIARVERNSPAHDTYKANGYVEVDTPEPIQESETASDNSDDGEGVELLDGPVTFGGDEEVTKETDKIEKPEEPKQEPTREEMILFLESKGKKIRHNISQVKLRVLYLEHLAK